MIRGIVVAVLLLLIAIVVACAPVTQKTKNLGWTIVQSPLTEKCYELASGINNAAGYMGMAEVDCNLLTGE